MRRRQSPGAPHGGLRMRDVQIGEIRGKALEVELARHSRHLEHGLQLARERDVDVAVLRQRVVQRLHPEPVAREQQPLPLRVPEREREHPAEVLDAVVAVLLVEVHDHLGVAARGEPVALRLELGAQRAKVVDLPVEDDLDGAVLALLRLMPAGNVDDREPLMREDARAPVAAGKDDLPRLVRAAMPEQSGHGGAEARTLDAEVAGDSTHWR